MISKKEEDIDRENLCQFYSKKQRHGTSQLATTSKANHRGFTIFATSSQKDIYTSINFMQP